MRVHLSRPIGHPALRSDVREAWRYVAQAVHGGQGDPDSALALALTVRERASTPHMHGGALRLRIHAEEAVFPVTIQEAS